MEPRWRQSGPTGYLFSPLAPTRHPHLAGGRHEAVRGRVLVQLRGQVVPGGQVLEAEQRVPVARAAAAGVVLDHLEQELKDMFSVG